MRTRLLAAFGATFLLAAGATAGVLDTFRDVVETRRAEAGLPKTRRRVLTLARDDLARGGLLVNDTKFALRAVSRIEGPFRRDAAFDAAEAVLVQDLTAAVQEDRATIARLLLPRDAKPTPSELVARADRKIEAALAAKGPLGALRALDAATRALAAAFPPMPAVEAPDDNLGSPTYQQPVTVRGQVNRISAWYFVKTT